MAGSEAGRGIIATTHSPYLLDRLPLQTVVLVERENGGQPVFWRPSSSREVQQWAKRFAPGELYTTGRLKHGARPSRPHGAGGTPAVQERGQPARRSAAKSRPGHTKRAGRPRSKGARP